MDKKFYRTNRRRLLEALPEQTCMVILSSGYSVTRSADETYDFQVNSNFYYLTGITQTQVHLVLLKQDGRLSERLYIDPYDEMHAKWIGHRLTKAEAAAIAGTTQKSVFYRTTFEAQPFIWTWKRPLPSIITPLALPWPLPGRRMTGLPFVTFTPMLSLCAPPSRSARWRLWRKPSA